MIPVQSLEAGGSEGLGNAPTVTQHKGESWDLNPGNTLLRMYVPNPFATLPLRWSEGARHSRPRVVQSPASCGVSPPRALLLGTRGHRSALQPWKRSTLAFGRPEGTWPEFCSHGGGWPLFPALLGPLLGTKEAEPGVEGVHKPALPRLC